MNRLIRSAWVIARRDYVAAVFSRTFLMFLIGPVLIFATVGLVTLLGGPKEPPPAPRVAIAIEKSGADLVMTAHARIVARIGADAVPDVDAVPAMPRDHAAAFLARHRDYAGVLLGPVAAPTLVTTRDGPSDLGDGVGLMVDTAHALSAAGMPVTVTLDRRIVALPVAPGPTVAKPSDRADLARAAQVGLFFFILLLAGMLLSNFIEEKSNKVIEVLAAAVPVDAIFVGKLAGMLAISVTAIAVWAVVGSIGLAVALPQVLAGLATPAVGWPVFCVLGIAYFAMIYLLVGAVFLGIGSQASSPREVQMLSMPVTMGQVLLLTFASAGVAHPEGWIARTAAIFPWSSPLAMIGRAAELPALWPHLIALAWQAIWLVLAIRLAGKLFRRAVLKSGGGGATKARA